MMTPEQIATWHQQARDNLFARKSIISPQDVLTEFARLVAQDTWELAAKICDVNAEYAKNAESSNAPAHIADADDIRAEAAKEPNP